MPKQRSKIKYRKNNSLLTDVIIGKGRRYRRRTEHITKINQDNISEEQDTIIQDANNITNINAENTDMYPCHTALSTDVIEQPSVVEGSCMDTQTDIVAHSENNSLNSEFVNIPCVDETHQGNEFAEKLREWAVSCSIERSHVSKLLKILVDYGHHTELPLDGRTLLETPRGVNVRKLDNGHYVHLGVKTYLNNLFTAAEGDIGKLDLEFLEFSFNMDGTPISTSGGSSFWPILGSLCNVFDAQPEVFVVGIFNGPSKPASYNNYLLEFVEEMEPLMINGYQWGTKTYSVKIKAIICDAPALAFVKAVKSHGGYSCCTKCHIKGTNFQCSNGSRKIVYTDINIQLRSDATFRSRTTFSGSNDIDHHMNKERSILERLPIDMIKAFPIDKMHLIDEGVVKKIIKIWLGKPGSQKLPASQISVINNLLARCYSHTPTDFQRKARTLKYANFLKASECRIFLLYTGPIVLRNILNKSTYKHFMSLSLAIRILTSPLYYRIYNDYAHSLLVYFVENFMKLYGSSQATYNIHGLLHIAADALDLGPLDEYSCYLYEAFIKKIKKMLHSFNRPLEQCSNRITEMTRVYTSKQTRGIRKIACSGNKVPLLSHYADGTGTYTTAQFHNFTARTDLKSDNCVMLQSKTVIRAKYFKKTSIGSATIIIGGQRLTNIRPLNNKPKDLGKFYFFVGQFEETIHEFNTTDDAVLCKMCALPTDCTSENNFFVVPINHTLLV